MSECMLLLCLILNNSYAPEVTKVRLVEARSTPKTCRKRREIKRGGEGKKKERRSEGEEWERE